MNNTNGVTIKGTGSIENRGKNLVVDKNITISNLLKRVDELEKKVKALESSS